MSTTKTRSATVFGAGVAGLTAAHELVERGFKVEVIDPDIQEHVHCFTLDRGIGGMARSQWACRLDADLPRDVSPEGIERLTNGTELLLDDVLVYDEATWTPADILYAEDVFVRAAALIQRLTENGTKPSNASKLYVGLVTKDVATFQPANDPRKKHIEGRLAARGVPTPALKHIRYIGLEPEDIHAHEQPTPKCTWAFFYLPDAQVFPAEHGFRFFPSFYRHVFDSLNRIPIRNPYKHERTHATVRENLLTSEALGFSRKGSTRAFLIPRRPITSLEEGRGYFEKILREMGYELSDIKRFALRLVEYMTSCSERREREYEHVTWANFVEREKYSKISQEHLEYGPEMAAALRGSESDTRTQGNIFLQLHMDQVKIDANRPPDCTLNGPTSSAWLNHWQDYLLSQGVTFKRGTLVDVDKHLTPIVVRTPHPDRWKDGANPQPSYPDEVRVATADGYIVLALSLPGAAAVSARILANAPPNKIPPDNDFKRTIAFAQDLSDANMQRPAPVGPLQHLSGIQYYFDVPISFWRGHTLYLDSEWGLTSIAQPQFWARPRDASDNYRGILSVDIGTWDRAYIKPDGTSILAWNCDAHTIADISWKQIEDHHDDAFRERYGRDRKVPTPTFYAIDANIVFDSPKKDKTPFLVNRVGAFPKRPGRLINDQIVPPGAKPETSKEAAFFDVYADRYVMVGAFTKTYTRLTSMEAANESARHGVNAILRHSKISAEHCAIWDPEDHEFPDLQWFRDLDKKRFDEKKPHILRTMSRLSELDALSMTMLQG